MTSSMPNGPREDDSFLRFMLPVLHHKILGGRQVCPHGIAFPRIASSPATEGLRPLTSISVPMVTPTYTRTLTHQVHSSMLPVAFVFAAAWTSMPWWRRRTTRRCGCTSTTSG